MMVIAAWIIGTVVFYSALVNGAGDDEWEDSK